ncbi:hypothetical protein A1O3_05118 [Capronia epimyces CBS 606.96]|uniref:Uncharacterized protein n=1 Tax=Capronia epimyces CBS 606.96 TaxID=1182542 RepID=W9Y494_9EURO|nr:uncharacterized protein A1O3_05118 [Capronia epimyces CBS 606.96]EXJ84450.1 hypothetical protein A1O3_05118 [Capronia epimyces CBS 606.96]
MARNQSKRGQDEKPRRLSKQRVASQPATAFHSQTTSLGGHGSEPWGKRRNSAVEAGGFHGPGIYPHTHASQSSIGPEEFTALPQAPTLLAKRKGHDPSLQRRKSSKRKAEDYAREREIRAMSSPVPGLKRPVSYSGSGPLRRDTKQVPGDLNRRLHRPASEISLPLPETIQESEDMTSQASFKIGILAALSPRPTLTYVANPRTSVGKQPARIKPSIQQAIEEEDVYSKKRIDELADELDAGGLRELMERDRRRHERKRAADRDRLHRKLQRKAERQREEELRGPQGDGLPAGSASLGAGGIEKRGRQGNLSVKNEGGDPFADPESSQTKPIQHIRNPFEDEKDFDIMRDPFTLEEDEGPPVPVRSPLRTVSPVEVRREQKPSQAATMSPPTSPIQRPADRQSLSQTSGLAREITPDIPEHGQSDRRASDQSSQQLSSWTSFFKRGGRRKASTTDRGRSTPSEFSNTSRESFARKQQPPPVVVPRTFRRSEASAVPQRTMSKFREDLPDFPISPPDSRVQSPEAMNIPQASLGPRHGNQPRQSLSGTLDARSLATSSSNPALDKGPAETRHAQSMDIDTGSGALSRIALSQSLASVDSEGSWLSGKPVKRLSGGMGHAIRHSQSSLLPQTMPGAFETEEAGLADDDYLNRLTPGPSRRRDSDHSIGRKASSTVIDLERERQHSPVPEMPPVPARQEVDETWHEGLGRHATVVRQPTRAKSTEGILREFGKETPEGSRRSSSDGELDEEDGGSPAREAHKTELQDAPLLRAQSVEYKGHARHISAGSARLLDIRRSSTQSDAPPRSPSLPQGAAPVQTERSAPAKA